MIGQAYAVTPIRSASVRSLRAWHGAKAPYNPQSPNPRSPIFESPATCKKAVLCVGAFSPQIGLLRTAKNGYIIE